MISERVGRLSFRLTILVDVISTRWSDIEPTEYGRHQIHPRGGKTVDIETPQGVRLSIKEKDVIHLRGPNGYGKVLLRFNSRTLPEGYKIIETMKGDNC